MANSVFQNVILQLRDITDHTFGVIDSDGYVVSCTDVSLLGECWQDVARRVASAGEGIFTFGQRTFKAIVSGSNYFGDVFRRYVGLSPSAYRKGQ